MLALSVALTAVNSQLPRKPPQGDAPPLLPRIETVRAVGAPFLQLVADYFWIQTVHAVGIASSIGEYRNVYFYASMVMDLDPKFREVYPFAGVVIPIKDGEGKWHNAEESTLILQRGVEQFPDSFYIAILLAYNLTHLQPDYPRAARVLERAALAPGAPPYLRGLITRLYARAGNFDAGLALASSLADSAQDPEVRQTFERRVQEIQLEKLLVQIDLAVKQYTAREKKMPADLNALVAAGDLKGIPPDPLGGKLVLGSDGRAASTAQEKRLTDFAREEGEDTHREP